MSWPDAGQPRYVVASVSGFLITAEARAGGKNNRRSPLCFQVLDRAYAHRLVREFRPGAGKSATHLRGRADARAYSLNLADAIAEAVAA